MSNWSFGKGGLVETLGRSGGSGTGLTSGGGAGVKGSWATLGTTSFPWQGFIVFMHTASGTRPYQLDVGVGATPDVIVADWWQPNYQGMESLAWDAPVRVPASTAVKVRIASNAASVTGSFIVVGYSGDFLTQGFSRAEQIAPLSGGLPSASIVETGTTLTGYTELTSAAASRYAALGGMEMDFSASAGNPGIADIAVGTAGSEQVIASPMFADSNGSKNFALSRWRIPCAVPAGSRVAMRVQLSGAGTLTINPTLMGFVP
jgi:hypothetical protein